METQLTPQRGPASEAQLTEQMKQFLEGLGLLVKSVRKSTMFGPRGFEIEVVGECDRQNTVYQLSRKFPKKRINLVVLRAEKVG